MQRKLFRIGCKLILLLIPFLLCMFVVPAFPMRFLDGEYAAYMQNLDWAKNHAEYCRVLIIGDSIAKAGYQPELLSNDTYNFALGGTTPLEEYYYLKDYLKSNDAPKYVIYTSGINHYKGLDTFWSRSVYFHRFSWQEFSELMEDLKKYEDLSIFEGGGAASCLARRFPTIYIHPLDIAQHF